MLGKIGGEYGKSATEQEIEKGLFSMGDTGEHVVGYMRTLFSIPNHLTSIYIDTSHDSRVSLLKLRKKIKKFVLAENILSVDHLPFTRYQSEEYFIFFENEMEKRIRKVIDREINAHSISESLYLHNINFEMARNAHSYYYGRERELKEIMDYVHSNGAQYPIIIFGTPGYGKTSFLSMAVMKTNAFPNYVVVPRFIGSGDGIYKIQDLVCSIFNYLRPYFSSEGIALYPFDIDREDAKIIIDRGGGFEKTWLHLLDSLLRPGKFIIFIDAIERLLNSSDRLNLYNSLRMGAYCNPYAMDAPDIYNKYENLRIIVSTAINGDKPENYEFKDYRYIKFNPFTILEKANFVKGLIKSQGRSITSEQNKVLIETLVSSEDRGIYLDMLGKFYSSLPSYFKISKLPIDFSNMAVMILNHLCDSGIHNVRLLRNTLAVIATAEAGIDLSSLNRILAHDDILVEELLNDSFHSFVVSKDQKMLPPILISRLYSDLDGIFLTTSPSPLGETIAIRHQETLKIVRGWLSQEELKFARLLQLRFFRKSWKEGNLFAVKSIVHLIIEFSNGNNLDLANELKSVILNLNYLALRINISNKYEIEKDFNSFLWLIESIDDQSLCNIVSDVRKFIAVLYSLPERVNQTLFVSWVYNLPFDIPLKKQISDQDHIAILKDILAGFDFNKSVVGTLAKKSFPFNKFDPLHFPERYKYNVLTSPTSSILMKEDQVNNNVTPVFEYPAGEGKCVIRTFPLQNIFTVLTANSISCMQLSTCKIILDTEIDCTIDLRYPTIELSPKGRYIIVNGYKIEAGNTYYKNIIIDLKGKSQPIVCPIWDDACFDNLENYLWATFGTNDIIRFDLNTGMATCMKFPIYDFAGSKYQEVHIPHSFALYSALDNLLIFSRQDFSMPRLNYKYYTLLTKDNTPQFTRIDCPGYFLLDGDSFYVKSGYLEIVNIREKNIKNYPFPVNQITELYKYPLFIKDNEWFAWFHNFNMCCSEDLHYLPTQEQLDNSGFSITQEGDTVCISHYDPPKNCDFIIFFRDSASVWHKKFLCIAVSYYIYSVFSSSISPSGEMIACGVSTYEGCKILIIHTKTGNVLFDLPVPGPIAAVRFSSDECFVIAADATHNLPYPINPEDLKFRIIHFSKNFYMFSVQTATIPNFKGKGRIVGYEGFELLPDNRTVYFDGILFDVFNCEIINSSPLPQSIYYYHVYGFNPGIKIFRIFDKNGLVISSGKKGISFFDIKTRRDKFTVANDDTPVAISPDETLLLVRNPEYNLYCTDISFRHKNILKKSIPNKIMNAFFHPSKKAFYAISREGGIYFYDLEGTLLASTLVTGILDIKVTQEGLIILREGMQVSFYVPSASFSTLPEWKE